jgi:hypothetical protein
MGGIATLASSAIKVLSVADSLFSDFGAPRRENRQIADVRNLELQQQGERAALEKEKLRLDGQIAEEQRQAALRRAVARQRAQYGASGVSSGDGSARAVLLGLFDESEDELSQRTALDTLKSRAIDQGLAQQQRMNTLQMTQLRQKERLGTASRIINRAQDIFG